MFQIISGEKYIQVEALASNTLADFIDTLQELFSMPEYLHRNVIWVLGSTVLNITLEQSSTVTEFIIANYPSGATRTKSALVVAPGLNESIAALWAGTAEDLPHSVRIFATLDQAIAWVTA